MTTLENLPNTALLVIDVQNGVVGGEYERDAVVANVGAVVQKARAAEVPVVWVQHSSDNLAEGSERWKIVPELSPDESEPLVQKRYPDSFEETTLESVLDELTVGRLVVVGAQTDECVRSTLHGALVRGYDAMLVSDAHTTEDLSPWGLVMWSRPAWSRKESFIVSFVTPSVSCRSTDSTASASGHPSNSHVATVRVGGSTSK